jgi:hypothetical protein
LSTAVPGIFPLAIIIAKDCPQAAPFLTSQP